MRAGEGLDGALSDGALSDGVRPGARPDGARPDGTRPDGARPGARRPGGSSYREGHPQASGLERLLRSSAGGLLLRPWFDDAALRLLIQWFFPLSRGWAAALAAGGSPDHFLAAIPCGRLGQHLLPRVLARVEARRTALAAVDARWETAFFGAGRGGAEHEAARLRAAAALSAVRTSFVPLHLELPLPAVTWQVEPAASVAERHGYRLSHPAHAFADSFDPAVVQASRGFQSRYGVGGWVRFPSPVAAAGTAWARVAAPIAGVGRGRAEMPSLVFAHGIAMETEFTGDARHSLGALTRAGIRVIRPEGPWHGRRRLVGSYGGEPVLARGPGGLLDYFHAHVLEIGRLVAWARATRGGPVAIGGVSLGALTAQLAAVAARHWPEEMRPDALFLVAPSRSLTAVAFEGSLTCALGVPGALRAAGWSIAALDAWRPLLEPTGAATVPSERIIVVLGESDDVTLAAGGEALVKEWRLPETNVFRSPAGHFSTSLGLARDDGPFRRLLEVLRG
jgi:pimeloyl-ACP methyl ester carboxylesterase